MPRSRRAFLTTLASLLALPTLGANRRSGGRPPVAGRAPAPPDILPPAIFDRADWDARPPTGEYLAHDPARLTVHHTAAEWTGGDTAAHLRVIQAFHQGPDRRWIDIAYHYLIDRDGAIFAGRPAWAVPDTATNYDPTGHLTVCLLGHFDRQAPAAAQVGALTDLTTWLLATVGRPVGVIGGHGDWAATSCPGDAVRPLIRDPDWLAATAARLA